MLDTRTYTRKKTKEKIDPMSQKSMRKDKNHFDLVASFYCSLVFFSLSLPLYVFVLMMTFARSEEVTTIYYIEV